MTEPLVISAAITKLQLRKGDVLVLQTASRLSKTQTDQLTSYTKGCLPAGVNVLVIDSSTTLGVLSRGSNPNPGAKARKA